MIVLTSVSCLYTIGSQIKDDLRFVELETMPLNDAFAAP